MPAFFSPARLRVVRAAAAAALMALVMASASARITGQQPTVGPALDIQSLTEPGQGLTARATSPKNGLVTFASTPGEGVLLPLPADVSAEERALAFVDGYGVAFGVGGREDVRVARQPEADALGIEHVRMQQVYRGVPVRAGEFLVHLRGARVVAANGKLAERFPDDVMPTLSPGKALEITRRHIEKHLADRADGAEYAEPQLEIFDRGLIDEGVYPVRLAWFVEVRGPELRQLVWVDARLGVVLFGFSQLAEILNRTIYTANQGTTLPGTLLRTEGQSATGDADADKAYDHAGATYNYYFTNHGRNSYDNAGGEIKSTVHFGTAPTSFWNGSQFGYSDGFSTADDVVAHEFTHAVIDRTVDLLDYNQSGALSESFADIFGEAVDLSDGLGNDGAGVRWLVGEDLPIGAVRNLMSPNAYQQPERMGDSAYFSCSAHAWTDSTADRGGVHKNGGVPSHAFALMVDGGSYNGYTVSGIGLTKAGKIQYRALTVYLTSGSGFADDFTALNQSCTDLVGTAGVTSSDCTQVRNALYAVEMDHPYACAGYTTAPALCPAGTPTNAFYDGFETVSGAWTVEVTPGSPNNNFFGRAVGLAKSGAWLAYGTDGTSSYTGVSDHRYLTTSFAIPTNARLYFDHAFEFESGTSSKYDGGILEYSADNGDTWTQVAGAGAGVAVEAGQSYNGTIALSANPLAGLSGFVASSYGYTGTRVNLSSLAGQNVRFRFRIGTDGSNSSLGWAIDNFQIYSCVPGTFGKTSPANGATGVPTSTTLEWGASAGATSYDVCVDTTNDNACGGSWVPVGATTSAAISGMSPGTTYYWHVRATIDGGTTYANGSSAAYWSFLTQPLPGAFGKAGPSNGATGLPTSLSLIWSTSAGAASYQYCYDTTNDSACSTWTSTGTANSAVLSGLTPGTTYYWQVRAANGGGTTYADGSSTAYWNFTTQPGPGPFGKASPVNAAGGQPTSPTLIWATSVGATSYEYCYDTLNDSACNGAWTSTGLTNSASPTGLAPGTTYYWQVRALNAVAATHADGGAWWSFRTRAPASDVTGDGRSDIVWRHATRGEIWLWPMNGEYRSSQDFLGAVDTNWSIHAVGDLTGDGKADLVWRHQTTGDLFIWTMNGATVAARQYAGSVALEYAIVGTADYNGDGKADLLWRHQTTGALWMWVMNGAAPTTVTQVATVPPAYAVVASGDVDGDGRADVLWRHQTNGEVWLWLMNGTASKSQTYLGSVPDLQYRVVGLADHTGDGKADILWWHQATGDVWLWQVAGASVAASYVASVGDVGYRVAGVGDYDGDGKADLLWHHATRGEVWVWRMNGAAIQSAVWSSTVPDVGYRIVGAP